MSTISSKHASETSKSTKYLKGEWCGCADLHLYSVNTHLSVRRVKVFSRSAPSREVRNHGSRVSCRCILFSSIDPTQPSSLRLVLSPSLQPHFSRLGLLRLSSGHHRRPRLDPCSCPSSSSSFLCSFRRQTSCLHQIHSTATDNSARL